jgi:hypothetical protein
MWHVHLKGEADNKSKGMSTKKETQKQPPMSTYRSLRKVISLEINITCHIETISFYG